MESIKHISFGLLNFTYLMRYLNDTVDQRYEVLLSQETENPISFSEPSDDEQVREWMNEICETLEGSLRERDHRVKSEIQLLTFATFPSCENDEERRFLLVSILITLITGNRKDKNYRKLIIFDNVRSGSEHLKTYVLLIANELFNLRFNRNYELHKALISFAKAVIDMNYTNLPATESRNKKTKK